MFSLCCKSDFLFMCKSTWWGGVEKTGGIWLRNIWFVRWGKTNKPESALQMIPLFTLQKDQIKRIKKKILLKQPDCFFFFFIFFGNWKIILLNLILFLFSADISATRWSCILSSAKVNQQGGTVRMATVTKKYIKWKTIARVQMGIKHVGCARYP